jgi:hypothetical protein
MSQMIKPFLVKDSVMEISDSVDFAVLKSGQNITVQKYLANSKSSSQHVYSIYVPTNNTVVSRNLIWGATVQVTVQGLVGPNEYLVNLSPINQSNNGVGVYGADCIAPFPLHQLCTNLNVQVNNTSITQQNVQQIIDPILRGFNAEQLAYQYGYCPTQLDTYGNYPNALPQLVTNAGALGAPVTQLVTGTWNSPFNPAQQANLNNSETSRASFNIVSVDGNTVNNTGGNVVKTVIITFQTREPFMCPPFIYDGDENKAGIVGINNITITASMDSIAKRALRWVLSPTAAVTKNVTAVEYTDAYIEMLYYTPKATDLVPAVCATPYLSLIDYISPPSNGLTLAAGASDTYVSQALQLNSISDKVVIWVDDDYKYTQNVALPRQATNTVADHYLTIDSISIVFNNQAGIMASFSQEQLYKASLKSGCRQNWDEFSGFLDATSEIPSCGSVLYLDFASVINVNEVYSAPGSLQTTQFQIQVQATNNLGVTVKPKLNVMFVNSAVLVSTNGNSSVYSNGLLTKNDVLNVSDSDPVSSRDLGRYIGGGIFSSLKALAKENMPKLLSFAKDKLISEAPKLAKMAREKLEDVDNKYARMASTGLKNLGFGRMGSKM